MHSQRAGTFAVIVAGEVSASVFVLTNTNGDTVASLGTGFYSTLLVPTFGLTLQHNDTTMTSSGLDWTYRNPAITVPSAVSEETVILRGPLVTGSNTAPRVEIKSKSTPGDIEGHVSIYSGARNAIDVAASVDIGYANADSFIIETADVIYVQPQDHIELASFRSARYVTTQRITVATGNVAPIPGGAGVQVPGVNVAVAMVAGDVAVLDYEFYVNLWAGGQVQMVGFGKVNGANLAAAGSGLDGVCFKPVGTIAGELTMVKAMYQYIAPANGNYTFSGHVVNTAGACDCISACMRIDVSSSK